MNKERRKRIDAVRERLAEIRAEIEALQQEEQDYADNMPENLHGGERHTRAEASADAMQAAADSCEEADSSLEEAVQA